jgi:hypothetical protein
MNKGHARSGCSCNIRQKGQPHTAQITGAICWNSKRALTVEACHLFCSLCFGKLVCFYCPLLLFTFLLYLQNLLISWASALYPLFQVSDTYLFAQDHLVYLISYGLRLPPQTFAFARTTEVRYFTISVCLPLLISSRVSVCSR